MNATGVHARYAPRELDQPGHRLDVTGQDCTAPVIALVDGELLGRTLHRLEMHVHLGRHTHAIQLLFPFAARDLIVHENDEREAERLSPSDDDLAMNEPIVDAKELNGHSVRPLSRRAPSAPCRRRGEPLRLPERRYETRSRVRSRDWFLSRARRRDVRAAGGEPPWCSCRPGGR